MILGLHAVSAGYGGSVVLRNVTFTVEDGEVVALIGPNGAGKSTLLRAAAGFVKPVSGRVEFCGVDVTGTPPHELVRRGICLLPEGRGIFPSLTVLENLRIQSKSKSIEEAVAQVDQAFPALGTRLRQTAGSLSGGEQQMLALCRVYLNRPKLLLVDEASLGLAPLMVDRIYDTLKLFTEEGIAVVVVEQYIQRALQLAKRVYVLSQGQVVHEGDTMQISPTQIYQRYLGVK